MAGSPPPKTDRPPYQPWYESDFWSLNVRTMDAQARHLYRALLLSAWDLNPPGYIPNDIEKIKKMADCWHPKVWEAYGAQVLAMFQLSDDRRHYTHPRQLAELAKAAAKRAIKSENGKQGGRGNKKDKALKNNDTHKATAFNSFPSGNDPESTQPNPTQPNPAIKNLLATSGEVAAQLLAKYEEEEQLCIAEIWPYYLEKCERDPKRYELSPQRMTKCVMRFKEARKKTSSYQGAIALMKEAIDNLSASDWNMGRSPRGEGKKYVDFIDHLFKSWAEMEKRLNDKRVEQPHQKSAAPVNNKRVDQEMEAQLGKKAKA